MTFPDVSNVDQTIVAMIESGEIPPRPDYVRDGDAWRRWYDKHVKCAHPSCIVNRERGNVFCTTHKRQHRALAKMATFGDRHGVTNPIASPKKPRELSSVKRKPRSL